MNELTNLKPPPGGGVKEKKRVGRGQASGTGKTAGRGGKGQKARSGNMNFIGRNKYRLDKERNKKVL